MRWGSTRHGNDVIVGIEDDESPPKPLRVWVPIINARSSSVEASSNQSTGLVEQNPIEGAIRRNNFLRARREPGQGEEASSEGVSDLPRERLIVAVLEQVRANLFP